jgi:hypothetical protein
MSIAQLRLESSRLKMQLGAMAPGTAEYYQVLAQLKHLNEALRGAEGGVRGLTF